MQRLIRPGDLVCLFFLTLRRRKCTIAYYRKLHRLRSLYGRLRVWRSFQIKRWKRYWRQVSFFGRVLFLRFTGANTVLGLQAWKNRHMVWGCFLLGAPNIVSVLCVRHLFSRRSSLVSKVKERITKNNRVFPLRRVHRIKYKVK